MREILFRAKNIEKDEWAEGYFAWFTINTGEQVPVIIAPYHFGDKELHYTHVDASTVRQYIGTYDCNGERIFEGDIIESVSGFRHHVVYDTDTASFKAARSEEQMCNIISTWIAKFELKVIGNVFDNPELLEGGKK
jgi:uncharacterized phage protein (TIGR01671 family)